MLGISFSPAYPGVSETSLCIARLAANRAHSAYLRRAKLAE